MCPLCLAPNIAKRKIESVPEDIASEQNDENNNNYGSTMSPSDDSDHVVEVPVLNETSERQSSSPRGRGNSPRHDNSPSRATATRLVRGIAPPRRTA